MFKWLISLWKDLRYKYGPVPKGMKKLGPGKVYIGSKEVGGLKHAYIGQDSPLRDQPSFILPTRASITMTEDDYMAKNLHIIMLGREATGRTRAAPRITKRDKRRMRRKTIDLLRARGELPRRRMWPYPTIKHIVYNREGKRISMGSKPTGEYLMDIMRCEQGLKPGQQVLHVMLLGPRRDPA